MRRLIVPLVLALLTGTAAAAPTLISYGDGGLKVGDTKLFDKAIDSAAHDAAQELIWFHSGTTLYVIDLRDAARKPVAIATKVPEGAFGVQGVSTADAGGTYAGLYPIIKFSKSPKVTVGMGAYGGIWEEQDAEARKAIKKIKLVGKKWLVKQAKRVARIAPAAPRVGAMTGKLVKVPVGADACDGSSAECGDSADFGTTGFQLVVISSGCGDACHLSCVLYNPKLKAFADQNAAQATWSTTLSDGGGSCFPESYGFHAGGEYYAGGNRCTASATGVTCTASEGWTHVGWLD